MQYGLRWDMRMPPWQFTTRLMAAVSGATMLTTWAWQVSDGRQTPGFWQAADWTTVRRYGRRMRGRTAPTERGSRLGPEPGVVGKRNPGDHCRSRIMSVGCAWRRTARLSTGFQYADRFILAG